VLYSLALLSTLAGNLLLSGSLTNLLIAEQADRIGAPLSFRDHARAGVPIALLSLGFAVPLARSDPYPAGASAKLALP
jgi:Na+/H+ antiporter NhaD/arsenite permease-like protein